MAKAVITGDIIHSTRMDSRVRNTLFNQIAEALDIWGKSFNMRSETFRGDSFQTLVDKPADALRIALIQKTYIRSLSLSYAQPNPMFKLITPYRTVDARIAIGIGSTDLLTKRLATSGGNAFLYSGKLLDKIKSKKQALAIETDDAYKDELETESILLDAILSKTTPQQCEVINLKLLGYTEVEIADRIKIIQSAVNQRSVSGNWNAIEAMVKRFEKIYGK